MVVQIMGPYIITNDHSHPFLREQTSRKHDHTYRGFPLTEQVRLSESPSRKMPDGGTILTVGATVGRQKQSLVGGW